MHNVLILEFRLIKENKQEMNKDQTLLNLKLSELVKTNTRQLMKITGKVDISSERTVGQTVLIYSNEETSSRNEVLVDTELIEDFTMADLNAQHDLIQFIGYKDLNLSSDNECWFKAMNYRVISRAQLSSYYFALDLQNSYIDKRKRINH